MVLQKTRARRFSPNIRISHRRRTVPPVASLGRYVKASPRPKHKARCQPHKGVRHRRHGMMMERMILLSVDRRARRWRRSSRESAKRRERSCLLRTKGRPVAGRLHCPGKAQKWRHRSPKVAKCQHEGFLRRTLLSTRYKMWWRTTCCKSAFFQFFPSLLTGFLLLFGFVTVILYCDTYILLHLR